MPLAISVHSFTNWIDIPLLSSSVLSVVASFSSPMADVTLSGGEGVMFESRVSSFAVFSSNSVDGVDSLGIASLDSTFTFLL